MSAIGGNPENICSFRDLPVLTRSGPWIAPDGGWNLKRPKENSLSPPGISTTQVRPEVDSGFLSPSSRIWHSESTRQCGALGRRALHCRDGNAGPRWGQIFSAIGRRHRCYEKLSDS